MLEKYHVLKDKIKSYPETFVPGDTPFFWIREVSTPLGIQGIKRISFNAREAWVDNPRNPIRIELPEGEVTVLPANVHMDRDTCPISKKPDQLLRVYAYGAYGWAPFYMRVSDALNIGK